MNKKSLFFVVFFIILAIILTLLNDSISKKKSEAYKEGKISFLREKKKEIEKEFSRIKEDISLRSKYISRILSSKEIFDGSNINRERIINVLKDLKFDEYKEGISIFDSQNKMVLWYGKICELDESLVFNRSESEHLSKEGSSIFIVSIRKLKKDSNYHYAYFRQIAFLPSIKSLYLKEYDFLEKFSNVDYKVQYLDYREDKNDINRFFISKKDEYVSKLSDETISLIFPLRSERGEIFSILGLNSFSSQFIFSQTKEKIALISNLFLFLSFSILAVFLLRKVLKGNRKYLWGIFLIVLLWLIRFQFLSVLNLRIIRNSFIIFNSQDISMYFPLGLLKSPFDVFFSSLIFFLTAMIIFYFLKEHLLSERVYSLNRFFSVISGILLSLVIVFLLIIFQKFLEKVFFNSHFDFFYLSLNPSKILVELGIFLIFFSFIFVSAFIFLLIKKFVRSLSINLVLWFILIFVLYYPLKKIGVSLPLIPSIAIYFMIGIASFNLEWVKKKYFLVISIAIISIFLFFSMDHYLNKSNRVFLENTIIPLILNQKNWGEFILEESLTDINKKENEIKNNILSFRDEEYAKSLWSKTTASKLNWPSALEIVDDRGNVLSRFSLNLPYLSSGRIVDNIGESWISREMDLKFFNKSRAILVGFKGINEKERTIGRVIFYLSIDFDTIPILYSENIYFRILRAESFFPTFYTRKDFGIAVYDKNGIILYNPERINFNLTENLIQRIRDEQPVWSSFSDSNVFYHAVFFSGENRIYSIFYPIESIKSYFLNFWSFTLIFILFTVILIGLYSFLFEKRKEKLIYKNLTFSQKVYLAFVLVAIFPFLMFSIFTREYLESLFLDQFRTRAISHLNTASGIFHEFLSLEREDTEEIPNDLILWINSLISRDINLYYKGKILASSRSELFSTGILPERIDGEIYQNLYYSKTPFFFKKEKIGSLFYFTVSSMISYQSEEYVLSLPLVFEIGEVKMASTNFLEFISFISTLILVVSFIIVNYFRKIIIKPILILLLGIKEVGRGNLEVRIKTKSRDEIKSLIDGFNSMVMDLKRKQEEISEMSKKAAWAEMARKAAHEIKNPLTPIRLSAEHILKACKDREDLDALGEVVEKSVNYIIKEVERLREISQEFLTYSQEKPLNLELTDVKLLISKMIEPYRLLLSEKIKFETDFEEVPDIMIDRKKIETAFRNLLINSIQAIERDGKIAIKIKADEQSLIIEIKDNGKGIPEDYLSRIFEPYFSTKDLGTGLGLPIAKKYVEEHGGRIEIESKKGIGTKVKIFLPPYKKNS
ncbi:MAG: ATP-binding protein [Acidobacteriota bacterium]